MQLTYKFRLYPSKAIEEKLLRNLELCRWAYNKLLELKTTQKLGKLQLQATLLALKRENPALGKVYSKTLQMVNHQLHSNLKVLSQLKKNGHRVGRLRFKGKGRVKTLNFNQSGFRIDGKRLRLSKIGDTRIELHRPIRGEIKGVLIKRENTGKWFAMFQVEDSPKLLPHSDNVVGIDVGLKHFLTDSDGRQIENPRYYRRTLDRIKLLQRSVSRKRKGSANRRKAVVTLNRSYAQLTNQRNDFLHKLSTFYVCNYGAIAIEDLRINNMVRNRSYAKSILDASWGKFFNMLEYKAEGAGVRVVKVNPRGTSQEFKHGELDRDFNASLNILEKGLYGRGCPQCLSRRNHYCSKYQQAPSLKQEAHIIHEWVAHTGVSLRAH